MPASARHRPPTGHRAGGNRERPPPRGPGTGQPLSFPRTKGTPMPTEVALLESPALRVEQMGRVEALDKVKSLVMLPDGIHLRTEDVARYFEVSTAAVRRLTDRHQPELTDNGMKVLRGADLRTFHSDMLSLWKGRGLEVIHRRARSCDCTPAGPSSTSPCSFATATSHAASGPTSSTPRRTSGRRTSPSNVGSPGSRAASSEWEARSRARPRAGADVATAGLARPEARRHPSGRRCDQPPAQRRLAGCPPARRADGRPLPAAAEFEPPH